MEAIFFEEMAMEIWRKGVSERGGEMSGKSGRKGRGRDVLG